MKFVAVCKINAPCVVCDPSWFSVLNHMLSSTSYMLKHVQSSTSNRGMILNSAKNSVHIREVSFGASNAFTVLMYTGT